MKKTTLIYGGGAMGSFLAACLYKSNHKIFFLCRGKNYQKIKKSGLKINVFNNKKILSKFHIHQNDNFIVINSLNKVRNIFFNNIFITTKITSNLEKIFLNIEKFINNKTLIITPCTSIPFWWFLCLDDHYVTLFKKKTKNIFLKNIKRKNLVGMTMWLSGKILKPGEVIIKHIQRGFPIKEVFLKNKIRVRKLRKDINKICVSPNVNNIFSEIFIKSINSLAFNLIALKYNQNNFQLKNNKKARREILDILNEGDYVLKKNKIKIYQTPISRITQTLKSTAHTMSMLNAYKMNKKIELKELWKSFEETINILKIKMEKTKNHYNFVKKKVYESF
tara:strand:+ start:7758 stop:8762 length:1005 start_codon:yes stop_codon:yes gene_type:complete